MLIKGISVQVGMAQIVGFREERRTVAFQQHKKAVE
jgi:hypothetical protein